MEKNKIVVGIYGYIDTISNTTGGVESQIGHIAKALNKEGFKVIIHCLTNKYGGISIRNSHFVFEQDKVNDIGDIIEYMPAAGPGINGMIDRNICFSESNKENIILAYGTRDGYVFKVATEVAKTLSIPFIPLIFFSEEERRVRAQFGNFTRSIPSFLTQEENELQISKDEQVIKDTLKAASIAIVPTHYIRAQIGMICDRSDTYKLRVIYHGVDPNIFKVKENIKKTKKIVQVNRMTIPYAIQKNFIWLAETVNQFNHEKFNEYKYKIIGSGNGADMLKKYVEDNNLQNILTIGKYIPQEKLADEYNSSEFLLCSSMMEAGATVMVEAALCGTLPIALNYAGNGEILDGLGISELGLNPQNVIFNQDYNIRSIVPNSEQFKELLKKLNSDESLTVKLRENAYKNAMERYTIQTTIKKLIDVLMEVM